MRRHLNTAIRWIVLPAIISVELSGLSLFPDPGKEFTFGVAWAQDDGGDDGGDDDSDDDGGFSVGRGGDGRDDRSRPQPRRTESRSQRRARQAPPLPVLRDFAPAKIVVTDLVDADLAILTSEGFGLIEQRALAELGISFTRLSSPAWTGMGVRM